MNFDSPKLFDPEPGPLFEHHYYLGTSRSYDMAMKDLGQNSHDTLRHLGI